MSSDLSEAETRIALIDNFLTGCGWDIPKLIISRVLRLESRESIGGGLIDYLFTEDTNINHATLLIEAKRNSKEFKILDNNLPDLNHEETRIVINQAHTYATHNGIPWFIVTNGDQWFVFKTFHPYRSLPQLCLLTVSSKDDNRNKIRLNNLLQIKDNLYTINDSLLMLLRTELKIEETIDAITSLLIKHYNKLTSNITLKTQLIEMYPLSEEQLRIKHKFVMRLLQRVIFVQMLEFFAIEPKRLSSDFLNYQKTMGIENPAYNLLNQTFQQIYKKFNGPLFITDNEKENNVVVEDALIEDIIIDFSKLNYGDLSEDIFGDIYEHFLGEIVKKIAKNENERKLLGQYYTPSYIVDYIIRESLIPLISNYNGDLRDLKIIDPACGSGSFLIKVYHALKLEYQRRYNIAHGYIELNTIEQKNGIKNVKFEHSILEDKFKTIIAKDYDPVNDPLRYNIYGIDITPEAIDLSLMNLMMNKLISDVSLIGAANKKSFILTENQKMFEVENLKCHDSLTESWDKIFSNLKNKAEFDLVLGNPPYVQYLNLPDYYRCILANNVDYEYLYQRWDLYTLFIERSIKSLKTNGSLCFIISGSFLTEQYAIKLREQLVKYTLKSIADLREYKIFPEASIDTIVLHIVKQENGSQIVIRSPINNPVIDKIINWKNFSINKEKFLILSDYNWRLIDESEWDKYYKIKEYSIPLKNICYVTNGLQISPIESFIRYFPETVNGITAIPYLKGEEISRYYISDINRLYFLYSENRDYYLNLEEQGIEFSKDMKSWKPKFSQLFENEKIVIPRIAGNNIQATIDNDKLYCHQTVLIVIPKKFIKNVPKKKFGKSSPSLSDVEIELSNKYDLRYILGVINSQIIFDYFSTFIGNGLDVLKTNVEDFPIPLIELSDQQDVIKNVEKIIVKSKILNDIIFLFEKELSLYDDMKLYSIDEIIKSYKISTKLGINKDNTKIINQSKLIKIPSIRLLNNNHIEFSLPPNKEIFLEFNNLNITTYYYLLLYIYIRKNIRDINDINFVKKKILNIPNITPKKEIDHIIENLKITYAEKTHKTLNELDLKKLEEEINTIQDDINKEVKKHFKLN